jgi:hypothetical protein
MQCSDIVATAIDAFACVETDVMRRVSSVARRKVDRSLVDDYRQSVLGALWESIIGDLDGLTDLQAVDAVFKRCNQLKGIWKRSWPQEPADSSFPELIEYRPEWLTFEELVLVEALLASIEARVEAEARGKQPVCRSQWYSQRGLAKLLDVDRSQVTRLQAEALESVINRCQRVEAEAKLYRSICEALAELVDE